MLKIKLHNLHFATKRAQKGMFTEAKILSLADELQSPTGRPPLQLLATAALCCVMLCCCKQYLSGPTEARH